MKKTYITTMPNHIGAFLQASRCFAKLGVNITRVSYNKAIDSHTLFIDAEGTPEQLAMADAELTAIGYLQKEQAEKQILLLEFLVRDEPGSATQVLELVQAFHFNISYISAQDGQQLKIGLLVDNPNDVERFLAEARALCKVRVIDYNRSEKVFDNTIFYTSFVSGLVDAINGTEEVRKELLINANMAMQQLDERGLSPYSAFDTISRFADVISDSRGEAFAPRITHHQLTDKTSATIIEPPCGSNTLILQSGNEVLFVDSGYSIFRNEMENLFRSLLPDWDGMRKTVLITHTDLDHCGLLNLFDEVLCSRRSAESLLLEYEGKPSLRERIPTHVPYIRICKTLTAYQPVQPEKVRALWGVEGEIQQPLQSAGYFRFADLCFEVYEGKGGHLAGEIVLIDYCNHIAITGDIYVNIPGMTPEQRQYNRYAPILLSSVDSDARLCTQERQAIFQRLGTGKWKVFGAHGAMKEYDVNAQ
ncbi:MAG: Zn-dependent hydrolase [Clostridia bacterium]|nr:Zn-dependent hydrolase [Clostridia bacterium]